MGKYHLYKNYESAHKSDVKAVVELTNNFVATSSRDGLIKVWDTKSDENITIYHDKGTINMATGNTIENFLNSLCFDETNQLIFVGANDGSIKGFPAFEPNNVEPLVIMKSHKKNVCSLTFANDFSNSSLNYICSSSWDGTAIIWEDYQVKYHLKSTDGYTIWDVKVIDKDTFITCSASRSICLWKKDKIFKSIDLAHDDVIRAIDVNLDTKEFVTCGNDNMVKLWDLETLQLKKVFRGHTNFVYNVKFTKRDSNTLISCGEDRSCIVWDIEHDEARDVILTPSISVWCLESISNGDIAIGSSDGSLRLFSTNAARIASESEISEYSQDLKGSAISSSTIDEKDIMAYDTISKPGNKDGQVVMVKNPHNGILEAYQYEMVAELWNKVGDVVSGDSGKEKNKKVEFEGKLYDFVFDVALEDDAPSLKLPFNVNENVYNAAEKFILKNNLNLDHREQIANFILNSTSGHNISAEPTTTNSSGVSKKAKLLPMNAAYLTLDHFKKDVLIKGIFKVNEDEASKLDENILAQFDNALSNPASNVSFLFTVSEFIKDNWDSKTLAFDILRIISPYLPSSENVKDYIWAGFSSENWNVKMMTVRALVNVFDNKEWGLMLMGDIEIYENLLNVIDIPSESQRSTFKNFNNYILAISTLCLNYSILVTRHEKYELLHVLSDSVNMKFGKEPAFVENEEAAYRLLIAFGNLSTVEQSLKQFAKSISWIKRVKELHGHLKRFDDVLKELV
ncbi:hypothetical protein QEN19_003982 [Hanseniaspora menglaensis]